MKLQAAFFSAGLLLACGGPKGPTGPEKAAAFHAQRAEREAEASSPRSLTEEESTLRFPACKGKKTRPFPLETEGAVFRAIVLLRIAPDGTAADHCYLAQEGPLKWEEKALGDVSSWKYDRKYAGEPRERVVTYRLRE